MKLDLHFGASVHCADKHCGRLHKVVVNPASEEVSDLIVQQGFLRRHAWVVPLNQVTRATSGEIMLKQGNDQLTRYPEYREFNVKQPMAAIDMTVPNSEVTPGYGPMASKAVTPIVRKRLREGIASGKQVVGHKTKVENPRRVLGQVDHVVIEGQDGRITGIVMRKGWIPNYFVVPMEQVQSIHDDYVQTSLSRADLDSLQRYEPCSDSEILEHLYDAMLTERTPAFRRIEPQVEGGIVELNGSVASNTARSHAMEIARLVPGVIDVQSNLVIEDGFERKEAEYGNY